MTSKQIASHVSEAISLEQQIDGLENRLDSIKSVLTAEAKKLLREESDIKDPINSGASYTFKSEDGMIARVNFPKPRLISQVWFFEGKAWTHRGDEVVELKNLEKLCGDHFKSLFQRVFKPAKAFRDLVKMVIKPADKAEELITLCQADSSPRVAFEVKDSPLGSPESVQLPKERRRTTINVD